MPQPITTTWSAGAGGLQADGMDGDRHGLDERRVLERQRIGQPVDDPRRHRHVLGKRAVPTIVAAGHAKHRPAIAEVDLAAQAEGAADRTTPWNRR